MSKLVTGDMNSGDVQLTHIDNCVTVYSPNYPNLYPAKYDMKKNIYFPSGCLSISMAFKDTFSINGTFCKGRHQDRVIFTQLKANGEPDGKLGQYCGLNVSPVPTISPLPNPTGGVRVRFRSLAGVMPSTGFKVEICAINCEITIN